ncbi:RHS repeat domain-containing protein [Pseudochryseolinea flava]|uniref:RHS repeat protein n=1 Tax=Pseudochryseolinea flava TaxID=2059302 RepID=A0A364XWW1_9BACT|nr:hypothetical protein [Pseudochryseolinea flava]RAV98463.1 hypothetical protein DQQ10_23345 [Pseudochryseolinea flava]
MSSKKQLFVLPFFLLIIVFACKQTVEIKTKPNPSLQLNWKTLNLSGKPTQIIETNYKQFVPDSMIEDVVTRENFTFDELGNLISRETFGEGQKSAFSHRYEYDAYGNTIKVSSNDARGRLTNISENILDSIGNAIAVKNTNYDGKLVNHIAYKYDGHGNVIERKQEEPPIAVIYKRKYAYDEKGRCILKEDVTGGKHQVKEEIQYDDALHTVTTTRFIDGVLDNTTIEQYDDRQQLISHTTEYKSYKHGRTMQYDKAGNLLAYIRHANDKIDSVFSYKVAYTYDKVGNWITRTKSNLDGTPRTSLQRDISYQ